MKYVNVVIDSVSNHTDELFTYRCSDDSVKAGSVVRVPFGSGNKERNAYVFGVNERNTGKTIRLKDVLYVCDEYTVPEELMRICSWMKKEYLCRYIDAVKCVIPPGKPPRGKTRLDPFEKLDPVPDTPPELTPEQARAVKDITSGSERVYLLNGVTSSGKTEVYMRIADSCISEGKGVIILVPEISLTPQTVSRFMARFGKENIAVLHSKLTLKQRYSQWMKVRNGEVKILIGARSGVFAPFERLGAIILDEEHESSYKSDMTPKYDAIDVAAERAALCGAKVVLGTATPSVMSRYRAEAGLYREVRMKVRYNKAPLPEVSVVDMRQELKNGNRSIFSVMLCKRMQESVDTGGQTILFINRRGYSSFVSCRSCGYVMKCGECGVSLTYHKSSGMAECHYCGRRERVPEKCPDCGSKYIRFFGSGTEQVEEFAKEAFPQAAVDRLDLDTASKKGEAKKILDRFKKGSTNILVGTQLVAKGLDFANVDTVGIVAADITLNIPDYRSAERTYQLIVQAAGRAGRGDRPGRVVIQTYNPGDRTIMAAAAGDYDSFYRGELAVRRMSCYPPFTDMIRLVFMGKDNEQVIDDAHRAYSLITSSGVPDKNEVFTPQPAYMAKQNENYRFHMIIKSPVEKTGIYRKLIYNVKKAIINSKNNTTAVVVEINPYSFI